MYVCTTLRYNHKYKNVTPFNSFVIIQYLSASLAIGLTIRTKLHTTKLNVQCHIAIAEQVKMLTLPNDSLFI